jgi:glucuronide carrier protein
MMANLTPNPEERIGLITTAKFLEMFGSDLPRQLFDIVRDVISRKDAWTAIEKNIKMRSVFLGFGFTTTLIAGLMSLYFAIVSTERVFGAETHREKPPTVRESISALRHNRPLLMLTLADVLGGFTLKSQSETYTKSILNFANFGVISGIPGSPVSYLSFAYVGKLRERFSTKFLWLLGDYINDPILVLIYFFGLIKVKNPKKRANGVRFMFMDLWPMMGVYAIQNTIAMTLYGANKVIPNELRNECIDYGEWKSGFRSEGMTGVLRGMPYKLTNMVGNTMTAFVLKWIGFQTGENYLDQSEKTARGIFALATLIPALMKLVSLVPKLLFNITHKDREIMYVELAERRALAAAAATEQVE